MTQDEERTRDLGARVHVADKRVEALEAELARVQKIDEGLRAELVTVRAAHDQLRGELAARRTGAAVIDEALARLSYTLTVAERERDEARAKLAALEARIGREVTPPAPSLEGPTIVNPDGSLYGRPSLESRVFAVERELGNVVQAVRLLALGGKL